MNTKIVNSIKELRNFLLFWLSQSLSQLGSSMTGYALLIWVYLQKSSTMSVALLAVCTYLPSILLSFLAGTFVDRHNKKKIMLVCDGIAAAGTVAVLLLMSFGMLRVFHIYVINTLLSVMNAFQSPADIVVVSAMVPKKYYQKTAGLQSISNSVVTVLTPAFATALVTFTGIRTIFTIDIITFIFAFVFLLLFIELPESLRNSDGLNANKSYFQDIKDGFLFLRNHKAIFQMILFFTVINLVAFIGGAGLTTTVASMVLSRIPDGKAVLGAISSAVGLGTLLGGFIVTFTRPPKSRIAVIFISCGVSFLLADLSMGLSRDPIVLIAANFIGNLPLAFIGSNQSVIMRTHIPLNMQGRVFSVRDTLQFCTIPLGYLLGGVLADYVFEPLMRGDSFLEHFLSAIVGEGGGSGIAVIFLLTGIFGTIISFSGLLSKEMRKLDRT